MCSIVRFGVISSFLYEIETFIEWKATVFHIWPFSFEYHSFCFIDYDVVSLC